MPESSTYGVSADRGSLREFHIEALALASFQIGHRFAFFSDLVRFISGVMIQRSWAIKLSS